MDKAVALTYVKRKKRRRIAAIVSAISSVAITVFIIIAFCLINVDRFTITTTSTELSLTADVNREVLTTQLAAPPLFDATDTQYTDIPEDIDEGIGSKNTHQYFAYSFYLGGNSDNGESVNYSLTMTLNHFSNDLEQAIRVMIIRNGVRRVYAQADESGNPKLIKHGETHESEPEIIGSTVPFKDNKHIILEPYYIASGDWDKYTVVMWIDGWESVNSMKSGVFQTDLKFSTLSKNV